MQGQINIHHGSFQLDMFTSGIVSKVGAQAFTVWCALKSHSKFQNGLCWPGMRCLMKETGLASGTVQKSIKTLEEFHLLRTWIEGRSRHYVPRERMDVKKSGKPLCTIVIDYTPTTLNKRLLEIRLALETGNKNSNTFANVEVIPYPGFMWDGTTGILHATKTPAADVAPKKTSQEKTENPFAERIEKLAQRASKRDLKQLKK